MKRVYLDYASTTPLDPRVRRVMESSWEKKFGNPSSIHAEGAAAKKALEEARAAAARALQAHADEIIFTSNGTEANNLAIRGVIDAIVTSPPILGGDKRGGRKDSKSLTPLTLPLERGEGGGRPHIVTSNIEHSSVLEPLRALERQKRAEVTYVPVESDGIVRHESIAAAIRPNTVLVSVMYANNEIGTIQPIRKIAECIRTHNLKISKSQNLKILFHVDACQAPLYLNCLVNTLGVDLMTLDGHKMYGPKGIGALYVRRGTHLVPQMLGGGQERGLRSATENVPAIVGFARALALAARERRRESERLAKLRDHLYSLIRANMRMRGFMVNGSMKKDERLPNNLNLSLPGVDTEFLVLQLDARGVSVSTKSSCLSGERESYVVAALGGGKERSRETLRMTLGRYTLTEDIERALRALKSILFRRPFPPATRGAGPT